MMLTRSNVLVSVMASAISGHKETASTPVSRREVMPENFCSWRLSLCSRSMADFKNVDLSSNKVKIMPKATKNLGVFHSSGLMWGCGQRKDRTPKHETPGTGDYARRSTTVAPAIEQPGQRKAYGQRGQKTKVVAVMPRAPDSNSAGPKGKRHPKKRICGDFSEKRKAQ